MAVLANFWEYTSPATLFQAVFLLALCHIIYHAFLGPLSQTPGPFTAKFSALWIVLQCRKARRSEAVFQQHRKHGPFVRIAPNHISISDRSALDTIYGHMSNFPKGPFYEAFHQVEPVLFNTRNTQIHQRKRKYLSPAFSAKYLNEYEPLMSAKIAKLMACFDRHITDSGKAKLDFNEYSSYLAFDVISDYAFGKSFGCLDKEQDHLNLIATIDTRGEVLNALGHVPQILRPFMKFFFLDPFWRRGLRASSALKEIGTMAYYQRRDTQDSRKDLLSFLFNAKDPDTGSPLTENEIIAESISFIVGGSDTTSSTMANVVDILSRSPAIQKQLQEELDDAFPGQTSDGWVADFKTVNHLPILNAVVRETMRFKPTSSTGLERLTPPGGKVIAGKYIPGGTLVSVPTLNIHRDSASFENPDTFDVSRWLDERSSDLLKFFHPFSLGPRACIGRNFAWMQILKALATLFKLFDLEGADISDSRMREGFFVKNSECKLKISRRFPKTSS